MLIPGRTRRGWPSRQIVRPERKTGLGPVAVTRRELREEGRVGLLKAA
jgi:hypothetical protein